MRKIILFLVLILSLLPVSVAYANPYTLWDGGNCCWYTWEMAKQNWNVELPWIGDARYWTNLDGTVVHTVDNQVYHIKAVKDPIGGSIMVFQPEALDMLNGNKSFTDDHYGHVAWVNDVTDLEIVGGYIVPGWKLIYVKESSIWPPKYWKTWHGCKYRDYWYIWPPWGMKGVIFLTLR